MQETMETPSDKRISEEILELFEGLTGWVVAVPPTRDRGPEKALHVFISGATQYEVLKERVNNAIKIRKEYPAFAPAPPFSTLRIISSFIAGHRRIEGRKSAPTLHVWHTDYNLPKELNQVLPFVEQHWMAYEKDGEVVQRYPLLKMSGGGRLYYSNLTLSAEYEPSLEGFLTFVVLTHRGHKIVAPGVNRQLQFHCEGRDCEIEERDTWLKDAANFIRIQFLEEAVRLARVPIFTKPVEDTIHHTIHQCGPAMDAKCSETQAELATETLKDYSAAYNVIQNSDGNSIAGRVLVATFLEQVLTGFPSSETTSSMLTELGVLPPATIAAVMRFILRFHPTAYAELDSYDIFALHSSLVPCLVLGLMAKAKRQNELELLPGFIENFLHDFPDDQINMTALGEYISSDLSLGMPVFLWTAYLN